MRHRSSSGLTIPELLVILLIIGFLWALSLPSIGTGLVNGKETQTLSNMKQLHLATQQMALDGVTTSDTNLGWPGDLGGSFERWAAALIEGSYLSKKDFCQLLSVKERVTTEWNASLQNTNAVLVYAVGKNTPGDAVFLSTANFTNSPTGGLPLIKRAKPYGDTCFIVFHKAGDGAILQKRQTGLAYTNIIGSYVPLCPVSRPAPPDSPLSDFPWEEVAVALGVLLLAVIFGLIFRNRIRHRA